MKRQVCTVCVMDNIGDKEIVFDEKGQCNYCKEALQRKPKEYHCNEYGKNKLNKIVDKIKNETKNDQYNCMVGVSGGIDSSYILYLGYQYDLKMMAVHVDDGLDSPIAKENIKKLCQKANVDLVTIQPNEKEYKDLILSFFKASVPDIAIPQDNILFRALGDLAQKYNIKYSLSGANFATESILARSSGVFASDKRHIIDIHNKYGTLSVNNLKLDTMFNKFIGRKYFTQTTTITPLNYIEYNLEEAIQTLNEFCDFEYYGGKHYESILTRFSQCYYMPMKYNRDKRKSHYSSLIVSDQMKREDAIEKLKHNEYIENNMVEDDLKFLANYLEIELGILKEIIDKPAKDHTDYKKSRLYIVAPIARKLRHFLG